MTYNFEEVDALALEIAKELFKNHPDDNDIKEISNHKAFDLALSWFESQEYRKSKFRAKTVQWNDLDHGRARSFLENNSLEKGREYWILPPSKLNKPIKAKFFEVSDSTGNTGTFHSYNGSEYDKEFLNVKYFLVSSDSDNIMKETPPHVECKFDEEGHAFEVVNRFRK